MRAKLFLCASMLVVLASCEKSLSYDDFEESIEQKANVYLQASGVEQFESSNAPKVAAGSPQSISELCNNVTFVVFNGSSKLKTVNQSKGDSSFGSVALTLDEGTYKVLIVAHNGDGNATVTSAEKITFPSNRVTDTFYYYGDITVEKVKKTYNMQLQRAVSMFRLVVSDNIPGNVKKMKFYYTGGSSTFSAATGYGSVNSRQTEVINVDGDENTFEVFTFPHAETGKLKMTVTALDASDNVIAEKVFEEVPVTRNQITCYTGYFFSNGGSTTDDTFYITANGDWDAVNNYRF